MLLNRITPPAERLKAWCGSLHLQQSVGRHGVDLYTSSRALEGMVWIFLDSVVASTSDGALLLREFSNSLSFSWFISTALRTTKSFSSSSASSLQGNNQSTTMEGKKQH